MLKIRETALVEMINLASRGFEVKLTVDTDGEPMVIAEKNGLVRQFPVEKC